MKKLIVLCILMNSFLFSGEPSGKEALKHIIDIMNPDYSKGFMKQTIVTTSGQTRVLEYETFMGEKGKYSLMRYISPSRVKGNAILLTDFSDNIWSYNSRTKRVRKLASHAKKQKFEGSDFTFEDMGSGDAWLTDYSPRILGIKKMDGMECYELEMISTREKSSYSKLVTWSRVSDFFPVQIDYYDENGTFSKSLYLSDIQVIDSIPTAMTMVMKNHLDNTETQMVNKDITYDVHYEASFFSERNLKR